MKPQDSKQIVEKYQKIYIKSEEDLPKESGYYFTHKKKNYENYPTHPFDITYFRTDTDLTYLGYWKGIDWYLQPLEQSPPENSEIKSVKEYFMSKCGITELDDIYTLHYSELFQWMEEFSQSSHREITDEDINTEADKRFTSNTGYVDFAKASSFVRGAKWYRSQNKLK
jgi:hypothetical protein